MNFIPPPVYGAVTLLIMWLLHKHYPIMQTDSTWPLYAGIAVAAIGLLIDLVSVLNFRNSNTTVNPLRPENTSTLVTDGFYSISRNPMYLGMAIILTGAALIMRSLSPLAMPLIFCLIVTYVQIIPEEKVLAELFGDDYQHYKRRVARWV